MLSRNTGWFDLRIVVGISVLAIFLLAGIAWAQPHEEWNMTLAGNASASSVVQTLEGGYIIAGNKDSYDGDAWIIKTDPKGNEQWNKTFKGEEERNSGDWGKNQVSSVKQTSDNGYILAGSILEDHTIMYGNEGPDYGVWLIKTDAKGLIKVSGEPDRLAIPDQTPATVPAMSASTEKVAGFGAALAIMILLVVYKIGRKRL